MCYNISTGKLAAEFTMTGFSILPTWEPNKLISLGKTVKILDIVTKTMRSLQQPEPTYRYFYETRTRYHAISTHKEFIMVADASVHVRRILNHEKVLDFSFSKRATDIQANDDYLVAYGKGVCRVLDFSYIE